ncbi:MAG: EAL domain-containing protein [Pseudomonadaceae bacterium]
MTTTPDSGQLSGEYRISTNFVFDVLTSARSSVLVKSICRIADSMNAVVVAEGVESEGISRWCVDNGIQHQQGYYFSKPIPFNEPLKIM